MQILDSMSDLDHIDKSIKQHLLPTKETFVQSNTISFISMKVRGILIITWQTFELFLIVSCIGCVNTRAKTNRNQEATNTREKNRSIVDFVIQIVIHGCACYSQNKSNNEKIHYLANFYSIFFSK